MSDPQETSDPRKTTRRALLMAGMAWVAILAVPAAASASRAPLESAPDHKHDWQREPKRNWVAPKRKKVLVGTDKNGKPVYEWKVVRPGRWEIEYKSRCRKCGKTKKG